MCPLPLTFQLALTLPDALTKTAVILTQVLSQCRMWKVLKLVSTHLRFRTGEGVGCQLHKGKWS